MSLEVFKKAELDRVVLDALRANPEHAGKLLNAQGWGACPWCVSDGRGPTRVHEEMVIFSCGHARKLPPLHRSNGDACMICNPRLATVTGLLRKYVA